MGQRIALAVAASLALSACNGGGGNGLIGSLGNTAYVRMVHGSADGGPVDVQLDGRKIQSNIAYGALTPYTALKAGSHTLTLFKAGNDAGAGIANLTFSVNSGQDVTVVIEGEFHPTYQASGNFGMQAFTEQPFNTPSNGGAVDFHNAAPIAPAPGGLDRQSLQFGYSVDSYPSPNALGPGTPYGGATNPQGLPATALNTPITLYAQSPSTYATTPEQISPSCSFIPCTLPNLSLYFVDGPKAARDPTTPPSNVPPTAKAVFFGAFDGNGLLTQ